MNGRSPAQHPEEWLLMALAVNRLGIKRELVYRLLNDGPLPRRFRYRHFAVAKKDGSARQIVAPGPDLMEVQRKILKQLLRKAKPHPSAIGFRTKKSIADHAWAHAGAAIIITADIEDFFPSTPRQRVKEWWHNQGYSTLETRLLTSLTTYLGSLPQGAPTSPALSNLVNAELDGAIERRVRQSGGSYTRYSDDMVFSWPAPFCPPADFENAIRTLLRGAGYQLHPGKGWHLWYRQEQPQVTGVILTKRGTADIPPSMLRIMQVLARSTDGDDLARLAGYEGYRRMVTRSNLRR
ncbi:MAG TPA: reverse transcriptase family protein [Aggregatilineales bacterium]|nr:reverse transcriptase family protein [Aggregatilineales bacterium]